MEEKLLHGTEAMEKAMKQEQDLMKTRSELEEKRRNQLRLEQELKAKEEEKISLQHKFTSQQEEMETKTLEIDKVYKKYQMCKGELNDM